MGFHPAYDKSSRHPGVRRGKKIAATPGDLRGCYFPGRVILDTDMQKLSVGE